MSKNSIETGVAGARQTPIRLGRTMTYTISNRTETDQIGAGLPPLYTLTRFRAIDTIAVILTDETNVGLFCL